MMSNINHRRKMFPLLTQVCCCCCCYHYYYYYSIKTREYFLVVFIYFSTGTQVNDIHFILVIISHGALYINQTSCYSLIHLCQDIIQFWNNLNNYPTKVCDVPHFHGKFMKYLEVLISFVQPQNTIQISVKFGVLDLKYIMSINYILV
jgi:hypothetical protein